MEKKKIAEKFLAGIDTLDFDTAAPYCADSFTYSGPLPKPVSLEEWRRTAVVFRTAFPDWRFNPKVGREEGNVVHVTAQVSATQTGDLDLTALDMGVVPATGKRVSLPESPGRLTFEGEKIVNLHIDVPTGGGVPGILAQLGVEMS